MHRLTLRFLSILISLFSFLDFLSLPHTRRNIIFVTMATSKNLWLYWMAVSSEGSVNLWLASMNRQLLVFSAFYYKKLMFDCIMWNLSLFQSLWPVPLVSVPVLETDSRQRMLLHVITHVEFGSRCRWLRTSSSVEVIRFWSTEL